MPEYFSNSVVYMTVLRVVLSIGLDEQEVCKYEMGTLLKIPFNTKMNVENLDTEVLELASVKASASKKQKIIVSD